jgi:hypothetical protein
MVLCWQDVSAVLACHACVLLRPVVLSLQLQLSKWFCRLQLRLSLCGSMTLLA